MSDISIEKAEEYLEAKEFIKALSILKGILKNEPGKIKAIRMSVKIYAKLAKHEKAIEILHNILELHPAYTWALFSLGSLYKIIGEYDKAIKIYSDLLKKYPENSKIPIRLAELYNKSKDYDKAIECLEKYLDYDPSDSIAWFELGFSYKRKDDLTGFRDAFSKALKIEFATIQKKEQGVELARIRAIPRENKSYLQEWMGCCGLIFVIAVLLLVLGPWIFIMPGVGFSIVIVILIFIVFLTVWRRSVVLERQKYEPTKFKKSNEFSNYNPEIIDSWQKIINFYWKSNQYENVIKICEYALLGLPLKSVLYLTLGRAYVNINFYSKAIEVFNNGIEIDSENVSLHSYLGFAYVENKEYTKAESILKSSLKIDSDSTNLLISYGRILYKNRKYEDSSKYYIKALNIFNQNIENLILKLPKITFPIKDNAVRKLYFNNSKDLDKKYDEFSKNLKYRERISNELGMVYLNIGEFDKAEDLAKESLNFRENFMAYNLLYSFYYILEDYERSIAACYKSLDIDENQRGIRISLIHLYFKSGNVQKAFEIINLMLEREPEDEVLWNEFGYIYSKIGEYESAIEALNRAIQINYKFANPWNHLGYIEYKKGNYKQALEYIKKAMKKNPDYARAPYYLAKVLYSQGKADEALVYCNECLKISPNFKDAFILRDKIKS